MPHIRPGCRVDYSVGRILFAGEVAGFLNPMGEGISAEMESGYCAANAVMGHFDNPETVQEVYRQSTENLKSYMQRQWSLVGGNGWHVQGDGVIVRKGTALAVLFSLFC